MTKESLFQQTINTLTQCDRAAISPIKQIEQACESSARLGYSKINLLLTTDVNNKRGLSRGEFTELCDQIMRACKNLFTYTEQVFPSISGLDQLFLECSWELETASDITIVHIAVPIYKVIIQEEYFDEFLCSQSNSSK